MSIEQRIEKLEYYFSLMLDMIAPEKKKAVLLTRHPLWLDERGS
ncbi:DUF1878 family protein, partial [Anoxybacillus sp. KU2-6(11)]